MTRTERINYYNYINYHSQLVEYIADPTYDTYIQVLMHCAFTYYGSIFPSIETANHVNKDVDELLNKILFIGHDDRIREITEEYYKKYKQHHIDCERERINNYYDTMFERFDIPKVSK